MQLCESESVTLKKIKQTVTFLLTKKKIENIINYFEDGFTPLHCLTENYYVNEEMIQYFIDNNVNLDQVDRHGNTPLSNICSNPSVTLNMIKLLATPNNVYLTNQSVEYPLILICYNDNITLDMLKYLLEYDTFRSYPEDYEISMIKYLNLCEADMETKLEIIRYIKEFIIKYGWYDWTMGKLEKYKHCINPQIFEELYTINSSTKSAAKIQ